jgi:dTDP-D-glucose 4,6-dehydratase
LVNLDKLTYAGNLTNLASFMGDKRYHFVRGGIGDQSLVGHLLAENRPRAVINFAAESHVDRSIHGPGDFIQTNVVGTFNLLEAVRTYWLALTADQQAAFRFLLSKLRPHPEGKVYADQITFVRDRPGHDRRYAIDASKIESELGWRLEESFETGIHKTVQWFLDNEAWVTGVTSGAYRQWVAKHYVS